MNLLQEKTPEKRLGWKKEHFDKLKGHQFFTQGNPIDWNKVRHKDYVPNLIPKFKDYLKMDYACQESLLKFEIFEDNLNADQGISILS